ncbi:MAG TPA: AraC family transcriptional regulator, partial [Lachnospiraceae bacterium]|nr:AraC family transcriptional regulator [Lachnospiraceae bacterium]
MGNIRHSFNTSNQETTFSQMPYRLLYSSYSKYEQDWESYPHTHYF